MSDTLIATNNLPEDFIKLGNVIWYGGTTSIFGWNCPAEIIEINHAARTFRVKSLDDLKEQSQVYTFDVEKHSPASRLSMRIPDQEEVKKFIAAVVASRTARILRMEEDLNKERTTLERFHTYMSSK